MTHGSASAHPADPEVGRYGPLPSWRGSDSGTNVLHWGEMMSGRKTIRVLALCAVGFSRPAQSAEPDLYMIDLAPSQDIREYGVEGDIAAYSFATISCNAGDHWVNWYDWSGEGSPGAEHHPVLVLNMYRLNAGRFEQVGMSWVKHGYCASNGQVCGTCTPLGCFRLGPQCSDLYNSTTNGTGLKPRSDIDASTGEFPYPPSFGPTGSITIAGRLQVQVDDIDPDMNPAALYFIEAHSVALDDASAGNGLNNVSWRQIDVPAVFNLLTSGPTVVQEPAILAWQANDPEVVVAEATLTGDGRFYAAARATPAGDGMWHYEYAVYNMNSHRSGQALTVPLPPRVACTNRGFHDAEYHSGEIYDPTDWQDTVSECGVTWATQTYDTDVNANALRWATLYNYGFDADAPPGNVGVQLSLFRPGSPDDVSFQLPGPVLPCPAGDSDGDGDIDQDDYGRFQRCFTGPGPGQPEPGCDFADLDHDGDVDEWDFDLFRRCSNGPTVPYVTGCMG